MIKSESLVAVHTHAPSLYKINNNEIKNVIIDKRGICQIVNQHKQLI